MRERLADTVRPEDLIGDDLDSLCIHDLTHRRNESLPGRLCRERMRGDNGEIDRGQPT